MSVTEELSITTCDQSKEFLLAGVSYFVENIDSETFSNVTVKSCLEGYTYPSGTPVLTITGEKEDIQVLLKQMIPLLERTIDISTNVMNLIQTFNEQTGNFELSVIDTGEFQHTACAYGGLQWTETNLIEIHDVLLSDESLSVFLEEKEGILPVGVYKNPASEFEDLYSNSVNVDSIYVTAQNTENLESELQQIQWYDSKQKGVDTDIYVYGWLSDEEIRTLSQYISGCIVNPFNIPRSGCVNGIKSEVIAVEDTPKSRNGVLEGTKSIYWDSSEEDITVIPEGFRKSSGHSLVRTFYDSGVVKNTSNTDDIREQTKTHNIR